MMKKELLTSLVRHCFLSLAIFSLSGGVVGAQTNTAVTDEPDIIINVDETPLTEAQKQQLAEVFGGQDGGDNAALPPGAVSCFDYYTFGSVDVNLRTALPTVVSGTDITFTGTITNNNPYPIVDGSLYVKAFKYRDATHDGNGPDVVDQFLVLDDVIIPAESSVPVSFTWSVPAFAGSGDYAVATFFTEAQRFNLSGLSFTDDIVGNTAPFSVIGETADRVSLDKTSVTVAGEPYTFASAIPPVDSDEPIEITARIRNESDTTQTAVMRWTTYSWDAQRERNRIKIQEQPIEVAAGSALPVSMTVTDTLHPVYLVEGRLQWQDTSSIINVRFARAGIDQLRINYPGITSFPLAAGSEYTLFSCLHNVGYTEMIPDGSLELTLSDRDGTMIESYEYTGAVTAQMMAAATSFTPTQNYNYVQLDARLLQAGEVVETVRLVYDCAAINPALCLPEVEPIVAESDNQLPIFLYLIYGALGLLFLTIAFIVIRDKPRRQQPNNDDTITTD